MTTAPSSALDPTAMAATLLAWYDRHARTLPWRTAPGGRPDPYEVWLSEIMLQQTTVAAVKPYFERFLARWPTVVDLAAAELDAVLTEWAGLGYYARARNLHKCAVHLARWRDGRFPDTEAGLRELPGVGAYTAAAVAAIAFGRRAVVVDGNVERVMARLFAETDPLPGVKKTLHARADTLTPTERAGDYAQAVMDLGATICTPRSPACGVCPWMDACAARRAGVAETLPRRAPKAERPTRRGVAFWTVAGDGAVLLRRRPAEGLLGGMMEIPSSEWTADGPGDAALDAAPVKADWRPLPGVVRHTFTHFHLELRLVAAKVKGRPATTGRWVALDALGDEALPSVMRKVVRHALKTAH